MQLRLKSLIEKSFPAPPDDANPGAPHLLVQVVFVDEHNTEYVISTTGVEGCLVCKPSRGVCIHPMDVEDGLVQLAARLNYPLDELQYLVSEQRM